MDTVYFYSVEFRDSDILNRLQGWGCSSCVGIFVQYAQRLQFSAPQIPGVVAHTHNHISWEVKVRAKVQDHPQLQSEFETSMEYMR